MHAAFKRPLSRLGVKASALLVPAIIALSLLAGCGGGGGSEAKGLLGQAEKAGGSIDSYHTSLAMFFEGGQQDGMKTEELVIDINGDDVRLKDTFYNPETGEGTVIQEVVRIGEKQYRRDLSSGAWVEEEPSLSEEAAATYTSHITDFASNSSSAEKIGVEEINGVNAAHLDLAPAERDLLALDGDVGDGLAVLPDGAQVLQVFPLEDERIGLRHRPRLRAENVVDQLDHLRPFLGPRPLGPLHAAPHLSASAVAVISISSLVMVAWRARL